MKAQINKIIKDLEDVLKKKKSFQDFTNFCMIITSIAMIIVTINSCQVTQKATDVQLYILHQTEKIDVREKILLAESLVIEINRNKDFILWTYKPKIKSLENITDYLPDALSTAQTQNARDTWGFGTEQMKPVLASYELTINYIKEDLQVIKDAGANKEFDIKHQRIMHFLNGTTYIDDNMLDIHLLNLTLEYQIGLKKQYSLLDNLTQKEALKLFNYSLN